MAIQCTEGDVGYSVDFKRSDTGCLQVLVGYIEVVDRYIFKGLIKFIAIISSLYVVLYIL